MDLKFAYLASFLVMLVLIALINTSYLLRPLQTLQIEVENVAPPLELACQAFCAGLTEGRLIGIILTIPEEAREKCRRVKVG